MDTPTTNFEKFFSTPEQIAKFLAYRWSIEDIPFDEEFTVPDVDNTLTESMLDWLNSEPIKMLKH